MPTIGIKAKKKSVDTVPFATLTALRAGFTYLPSTFKSSSEASRRASGVRYTSSTSSLPRNRARPSSFPTPRRSSPRRMRRMRRRRGEAVRGREPAGEEGVEGAEPCDGSDGGSVDMCDEIEADEEGMAELMGSPMRVLPFTESAKKLIREDPNAQGGSKNGSSRDPTLAKDQPRTPATPPKPPASIKGGVAVFRAKDGDWDAHAAMVRQAPRLCLLAQAKGANAAVFLWPARGDGHPPTQPLLPSPNFDVPVGIPAFVLPATDLAPALRGVEVDGWELSVEWHVASRDWFLRGRRGSMRRRARRRVLDQADAGGRRYNFVNSRLASTARARGSRGPRRRRGERRRRRRRRGKGGRMRRGTKRASSRTGTSRGVSSGTAGVTRRGEEPETPRQEGREEGGWVDGGRGRGEAEG